MFLQSAIFYVGKKAVIYPEFFVTHSNIRQSATKLLCVTYEFKHLSEIFVIPEPRSKSMFKKHWDESY